MDPNTTKGRNKEKIFEENSQPATVQLADHAGKRCHVEGSELLSAACPLSAI